MTREEIITLFEKTFCHEYIRHSGYMVAPKHSAWKFIDELADDFQSRTCENCKHFTNTYYNLGACAKDVFIEYPDDNKGVEESFSCNKFERKQNEV